MRYTAVLFTLLASAMATTVMAQSLPGTVTSIATPDGYQLQVYVAVPAGRGSGPFPLVVMPSSWGVNYAEYVGEANVLAHGGYVVVSYSSRGFGIGCALDPTCGYIDMAGPLTVGDVSTVITWALNNTPSNKDEIGVSGISYGAGTSLLAAENDSRIKAVASMSTWADLIASLNANQTPSQQGIGLLAFASYLGKPGALLTQANEDVLALNFAGAVHAVENDPDTPGRSPINRVAQINANGPAVFVANDFEDSLFVPSQLINFYNQLTVPKMMMFSHGDHTTAELTGAAGFPNEIYTAVNAWFDHYLKGVNNGINIQQPVQLKSQTGVWSTFANWSAVQQGAVTYNLTQPVSCGLLYQCTGSLSAGSGSNWQYGIIGGYLTAATTGMAFVSGLLTGYLDLPPAVALSLVNRWNAGVWVGPAAAQTQNLIGMPALQVTVTPTTSQVTLIAYLYDLNSSGMGPLITWKPYTITNAAVGVPQTISMNLEATNWQMNQGDQLALVISTNDLRYAGVTPLNSDVTFSSSTSSPSTLRVSLH
ncbi:X-Pro dipeptidyl-peptidase [Dyella sp. M7H15-1]|uniref:CocE/NonD family hydrolase n=1 Tax=Dyella sp. M7H15-1 TaxID=2501295 RepID=UPI001004DB4A|nr:CocE/NonD family hydrolase [Dyella sp. M7H15-1]QAU25255.1 X-Pro dipeptidyl-peptidase [Dyella sp. M7H15-1]